MSQVAVNKPEPPRPVREERDPAMGGLVPWEQGRLFAQLFAGDGEGQGYASALPGTLATVDATLLETFAEQLAPRLHATAQWPMQAAFYLPRLGRVNVCANREQGAWSIELDAEEERTRAWLGDVRQRVQDRLERDLGSPVNVQLAAP